MTDSDTWYLENDVRETWTRSRKNPCLSVSSASSVFYNRLPQS